MGHRYIKYVIVFSLLNLCSFNWLYGQDILQTKGGKVSIDIDYGTSTTLLQSSDLQVQLNYDNAELIALLDMRTVLNISGKDLGRRSVSPIDEISLKAKFGIEYINTKNHEPLQFDFTGVVTQNEIETPIHGIAQLQHIGGGGEISCLLGFNFIINRESLPNNLLKENNVSEIRVQVLQTILKRDN